MKIKYSLLAAFAALLLVLSGCAVGGTDELYSLPRPQEKFLQLQTLIDHEINSGSEYSAPTAGTLRQSVQLADLDGDGTEEALAFLKNKELQPEICIFRSSGEEYELAGRITGEGTGIGCFEYSDLDGDGFNEIMVSWRMSGELFLLKIYSLKDWVSSVLLTADCRDFRVGDVDKNGFPDVLVLSFEPGNGILDKYSLGTDGEMAKTSAKLSSSLTALEQFTVSSIADKAPAILVEGICAGEEGESYLTDIFVCIDGKLKSISTDPETGNSVAVRDFKVYSTDIDKDGCVEVPYSRKLFTQPKVNADYYMFDWYCFDINGESSFRTSTYHNYGDGWFFMIPEQWRENLTVRRETASSGERSVVLSVVNPNSERVSDMLTIYTLTDENRAERARLAKRFVLLTGETAIYAARLNYEVSEADEKSEKEDMTGRFRIIYTDWNTGVG